MSFSIHCGSTKAYRYAFGHERHKLGSHQTWASAGFNGGDGLSLWPRHSSRMAGAPYRNLSLLRWSTGDLLSLSDTSWPQALLEARSSHWKRAVYLITSVATVHGEPGGADSVQGVNLTREIVRNVRINPDQVLIWCIPL